MEETIPERIFGEVQWLTPHWLYLIFSIRIGILRVWDKDKNPGIKNKEEYCFAATVVDRPNKRLEIMGVDKAPSLYVFKEIIKTLSSMGYKTGYWTRVNTGQERTVEFTPKRK